MFLEVSFKCCYKELKKGVGLEEVFCVGPRRVEGLGFRVARKAVEVVSFVRFRVLGLGFRV